MSNASGHPSGRDTRRKALRARQTTVFTALGVTLGVIGIGATLIYTGVVDSPIDIPFATAAPSSPALAAPPCPTQADAAYLEPKAVKVNVYNATSKVGLAKSVQLALGERGFAAGKVGDEQSTPTNNIATIRTGVNGIPAAYTLLTQLPQAEIKLDARETPDIDLVVGEDYSTLATGTAATLTPGKPLSVPSNCVKAVKPTPTPDK